MFNSFKLFPTHFYREGESFSKGSLAPCASRPWLQACTQSRKLSGSLTFTRVPQVEQKGLRTNNSQYKANLLGNQF